MNKILHVSQFVFLAHLNLQNSGDVSLMLLRVGAAELPAKIKWIDLFKKVKANANGVQYRVS